ncbi:hypothetical protein [Acinetobacter pittii]|uniref:hypothetical protein n=1 Tax=Acinetobacter pittii TaxID=48296 RepID=UPI0028138E89|nr:hypothetical protein [Acinetobacter pittii]MDQ9890081.1 hypothetical protein [Acinetobacter pittii]
MYLPKFFDDLEFAEKFTLITTTLLMIGFAYKIGFYYSSDISVLFIIQYFSFTDLIYSSLQLVFVFFFLFTTFNKILVVHKFNRNLYIFTFLLAISSLIIYFYKDYIPLVVAILLGVFFSLLFYHADFKTAVSFAIVYVLVIPFLIGSFKYNNDLKKGNLPKVTFAERNKKIEDWRILDKIGDKSILINLNKRNEFKVVSLDSLDKISS